MPITLTINAENAEDLRTQLHVLLGASASVTLARALEREPTPEKEDIKSPSINVPPVNETEVLEEKQEVKPRRAHRRVNPKPEPQAKPEPSEPFEFPDDAPQEVNQNLDTANGHEPVIDPVEAQKIKDEILPKLRDLFVSGQVKQVRAILDKFGAGAKSIPEIDAAQFPAIKEFLAEKAA